MGTISKVAAGLKTLGRVSWNAVLLRFEKSISLNFGAGGTRLGEYINVDSLLLRETDLLCELQHLPWFVRAGSVSHIYASHVLEHFAMDEVVRVIGIAYRLLAPGGELRISVPDFDKIATLYTAHRDELLAKDPPTWLGVIYGGQSSRYDFHKTGFTPPHLAKLLAEAGFTDMREYDAEEFLAPYGARDSSLYRKDFGGFISLNMVARK